MADENHLTVIKALGGRFVTHQRRIAPGFRGAPDLWDTRDCLVFRDETHGRFAGVFLIEPRNPLVRQAIDEVVVPTWPDMIRDLVPHVVAQPSTANLDQLLVALKLLGSPVG